MAHIRSLFFSGPLADIENKALESYKKGRPSEIIWNITNACNLLCEHCYVGATEAHARKELTDEETISLVRQIGELEVPLLFITGGEPMLRRNFWDILATARAYGIRVVISTNATLIDAKVARYLKAGGVDYAAISLYGPEAFHDDMVKVPGTYQKIRRAVEHLKAAGVGVCIKTSVTQATWPHIYDTIATAKDWGAKLFYPCDLITAGRSENANEQRVSAEQWRELADFMLDDVLSEDDEHGIEYDIGAMPSIAAYLASRLVERGYDISKALDRLAVMSACPVGKGLMNINSEGDILPCSFAQDYRIGNVRDMSLAEAVEILFEIGRTEPEGRCATCDFSRICRGCRTKAWHHGHNIQGEDPTCMLAEVCAPV
jgi:radical SAM protein with 4Fe4S-binding SPASM domain